MIYKSIEMIKSIKIQNFQSHEKSNLYLSDGVNIIVGSSDSGKTAIIRALRWACWNRPSGDSIRSNWGGDTFVLIETEEGAVIRFKGKEDKYELKAGGDRSITFKAFGTNVPQEIATFFNINEINLQSQHDSPFLISETPGAVAAHFNKVAHLDKIDTATSKINGWLRGLKSDIEHTEADIESEKEKLKAFEHLDKFEAELEVLEALAGDLSVLRNKQELLRKDTNKYRTLATDISKYEDFVVEEPLVDSILILISQRDEKRKQYGDLVKITKKLNEIVEDETSINYLLDGESLVDDLIDKSAKVKAIQSDYTKLKSIIKQINQCQSDISTFETHIKESEEQFHKEIGEVCPLCDQPIKKK